MTRKLTTEEFIKKARAVHGDKYDYSLVEYVNSRKKVKIICKEHGVFEQVASNHLRHQGCPACSGKAKSSTEEFIEKAKSVHGDKYVYSLVEYLNVRTKVKIICRVHGVFEQEVSSHLKGNGCKKCGDQNKKGGYNLKYLTEEQKVTPSLLYHVRLYKDGKYLCDKVGVTIRSIKIRFRSAQKYGLKFRTINKLKGNLEQVLTKEQEILAYLDDKNKRYKTHLLKDTEVCGWTECFYRCKDSDKYLKDFFNKPT